MRSGKLTIERENGPADIGVNVMGREDWVVRWEQTDKKIFTLCSRERFFQTHDMHSDTLHHCINNFSRKAYTLYWSSVLDKDHLW